MTARRHNPVALNILRQMRDADPKTYEGMSEEEFGKLADRYAAAFSRQYPRTGMKLFMVEDEAAEAPEARPERAVRPIRRPAAQPLRAVRQTS